MLLTTRTLLLAITVAPWCAFAQQWYCQNENEGTGIIDLTYGDNGYNGIGGVAFVAGGKAFFGHGLAASGQPTNFFVSYDPTTNRTSDTDIPTTARAYGTGFGIGTNTYVGLGLLAPVPGSAPFGFEPYHQDFFMVYDAHTAAFVDFIEFPGGPRRNAFAFTIGDIAYVGGGQSVDTVGGTTTFTPANDLWAYNATTQSWTARTALPTTFTTARVFNIGNKGYLMRDGSAALWEYDALANTWITRAPFPGGARTGFSAFALNGIAYVGCGRTTTDRSDFFAFDPATNTWSPAPAIWDGFGRANALAFSLGDSGFLVGGTRTTGAIRDGIWRFGPATEPAADTWTQRPFLPAAGREHAIAFSIGNKGYVGGGGSSTDFWEYDPATLQWTTRAALPGPVDEGFSIDGIGYVTRPIATGNFHAYDPATNTWSPRADLPGGARSKAASFAVEGKGYICAGIVNGVPTSDLWRYDPASDAWTQRANRPNLPAYDAMGVAVGNKGYVMGGSYNSSVSISANHQYDPATDTWTTKASMSHGQRNAQVFAIGNLAYLGGGWSSSSLFLKQLNTYNPATNTWTALGDMGGLYRNNGVGFAIGDKGYLCTGRRSMTSGAGPGPSHLYAINDLWEFTPSTIELDVRVVLDGPYDNDAGLMNDHLRAAGLLSIQTPYGPNGYPHPGGTYSDSPSVVPSGTGPDAVVDRIVVELRSAAAPAQVLAARHVWLQRDGDIVDMDGSSPVRFTLGHGNYHVAVQHRNHLGIMSAAPIAFGNGPTSIDLSLPATATYGSDARKVEGGVARMWCGDVTYNGQVKYLGGGNDRDPILLRVGGAVPTQTAPGYYPEDVDLDGVVKYAGAQNDRDRILGSIGGSTVTTVRNAQLP